ncbi:hypothetical protein LTR33_009735, partial [Friedmanniomyces endolithicus]
NGGDGAQIDTEEVAGRYPDGGEEDTKPGDQEEEGHRLGMWEATVEDVEVGGEACFVFSAVLLDECALVRSTVDEAALFVGILERAHLVVLALREAMAKWL